MSGTDAAVVFVIVISISRLRCGPWRRVRTRTERKAALSACRESHVENAFATCHALLLWVQGSAGNLRFRVFWRVFAPAAVPAFAAWHCSLEKRSMRGLLCKKVAHYARKSSLTLFLWLKAANAGCRIRVSNHVGRSIWAEAFGPKHMGWSVWK